MFNALTSVEHLLLLTISSFLGLFTARQLLKKRLKSYDPMVDKAEAMFIGWLFAFLADLSTLLVELLIYVRNLEKIGSTNKY